MAEADAVGAAFPATVMEHLIQFHNAKDKGVRLRVTQLVGGIINSMSEDAELSDELWEELVSAMTMRAKDKIAAIREQAVLALKRLQDAEDEDDRVVAQLLQSLHTDSSKDVRTAVLRSICVTRETLPAILEHVRDEAETVRVGALGKLRGDVGHALLRIGQRAWVLEQALGDREAKVQTAAAELMVAWLGEVGFDVVKFIGLLDAEAHEAVAETAVRALFDHAAALRASPKAATDETAGRVVAAVGFSVVMDRLTPESALFWRVQCQWAAEKRGDASSLLPDVVVFSEILERYAADAEEEEDDEDDDDMGRGEAVEAAEGAAGAQSRMARSFVFRQLLVLARQLDWADEAGRQSMLARLRTVVRAPETDEEHVRDAVRVLALAHAGDADFVTSMAEQVSDMVDAGTDTTEEEHEALLRMAREVAVASRRTASLQARADAAAGGAEAAAAARLLAEAEAEEEQLTLLQNEMQSPEGRECHRWARALLVAAEVLLVTRQPPSSPALRGLLQSLVLPGVQRPQVPLRAVALRCLALYCLKDEAAAELYLPLFVRVLENDAPSAQDPALKAIVDLQLAFPALLFRVFKTTTDLAKAVTPPETEEGQEEDAETAAARDAAESSIVSPHRVLSLLRSFASWSAPPSLRAVAVEGIAKLLITRRVQDDEALTLLLHTFFLPTDAVDELTSRGARGDLLQLGAGAAARAAATGLAAGERPRRAKGAGDADSEEEDSEEEGSEEEEEEAAEARNEAAAFAAARIRQCLSVFFPALALGGEADQRLIERVALPALRRVAAAPSSSPLSRVDCLQFVQYLVFLLGRQAETGAAGDGADAAADDAAAETTFHDRFALQLLIEIATAPKAAHVKDIARALPLLQLTGRDPSHVRALIAFCEKAVRRVTDRTATRALAKFQASLQSLAGAAAPEEVLAAAGAGEDAALAAALRSMQLDDSDGEASPGVARRTRTRRTRGAAATTAAGGKKRATAAASRRTRKQKQQEEEEEEEGEEKEAAAAAVSSEDEESDGGAGSRRQRRQGAGGRRAPKTRATRSRRAAAVASESESESGSEGEGGSAVARRTRANDGAAAAAATRKAAAKRRAAEEEEDEEVSALLEAVEGDLAAGAAAAAAAADEVSDGEASSDDVSEEENAAPTGAARKSLRGAVDGAKQTPKRARTRGRGARVVRPPSPVAAGSGSSEEEEEEGESMYEDAMEEMPRAGKDVDVGGVDVVGPDATEFVEGDSVVGKAAAVLEEIDALLDSDSD